MRAAARVIDAAANRAREGLRVMEDVARFGLDDRDLCARLKTVRHDLMEAIGSLRIVRTGLTDAARDTPGDVGTTVSTDAEGARADLRSVAVAASKRAQEAVRSIEEFAKLIGDDSGIFEKTRYELYELERRLVSSMVPRAEQWALCVLITGALCRRPWEDVAEAAIAGGAGCLQLREKELDSGELLSRARRLVEIAGERADVIINDRADIAMLSGASGVHVGQTDLSVAESRAVVGQRALVGVSCSTAGMARRALADGASYVGLGPVFVSETKPKPGLAGIELVRDVVSSDGFGPADGLPHLAISGITAQNAGELRAIGCRGVAVSGAVCGADDPEAASRAIVDVMDRAMEETS